MTKQIKERVLAVILTVVLAFSSVILISQSNTVYASAAKTDRVVVSMGDSYSSGEGIKPFFDQNLKLSDRVKSQNWLAHRSQKAWSGMLKLDDVEGEMSDHYNNNWFFVAASGAVTADIKGKQRKEYVKDYLDESEIGVEFLDPQIKIFKQLNKKGLMADYVTLTLGGNDVGFQNVIISALNPGDYLFPNNLYDQFHYLLEDGGIDKVLDNLEESYDTISKAAGEQAHIIVAGYPKLFNENGKGFFVRKDSANVINDAVGIFNNKIEELIIKKQNEDKMNIHFVSVEKAFKGKAAYSKNAYINGICIAGEQDIDNRSPIGAASFHPNEKGARAYAGCVQAEIDRLEGKTPRPKPTEKPTDKPVQIPTHKPTETPKKRLTEDEARTIANKYWNVDGLQSNTDGTKYGVFIDVNFTENINNAECYRADLKWEPKGSTVYSRIDWIYIDVYTGETYDADGNESNSAPTVPATESQLEEWQRLYIDLINDNDQYSEFALVQVTNENVPNLIFNDESTGTKKFALVFEDYDPSVPRTLQITDIGKYSDENSFFYQERGLSFYYYTFTFSHRVTTEKVYQIGGKPVILFDGTSTDGFNYEVNGSPQEKPTYDTMLKRSFDFDTATQLTEFKSKNEIINEIKNY